MQFTGDFAQIQQAMSATRDIAARRMAVLHELAPRRGERVIEIGCGAGLCLREIGLATGPHGLALGLDVSPDQIAAAARECAGVPGVATLVGDVAALDYPGGVFDAAVALQAIEYVSEVEAALGQIRRVLKPGARFVCLATNWDSDYWHGADPALTAAVVGAWKSHLPWPNLPAVLGPMLTRQGFAGLRQTPVPVVNADFAEAGLAPWLARLMAGFAAGAGVAPQTTTDWLDALARADAEGEFFFSSVPILTTAIAV